MLDCPSEDVAPSRIRQCLKEAIDLTLRQLVIYNHTVVC